MRGYLDRDDLTAQVVSHGWFATGDIGVIDERGWLTLRGREREEINKGGMKVYPGRHRRRDRALPRHARRVRVCVQPTRCLEKMWASRWLSSRRTKRPLRELYQWTRQHLAAHQVPQRWYVLDEIPRTSRGKVNRTQIAEHCMSRRQPLDMSVFARMPHEPK